MGGPLSEWFPPCEGKGGRRIRDQERSTDSGMVSAGEYERNVAESLLIGDEKGKPTADAPTTWANPLGIMLSEGRQSQKSAY